jgi:TolB-like protein/DNA-binding SARP family transcriptional activator
MNTRPTPRLQLDLLGRFELSGPDGRPIDLTSKKLAALLAFLACTAPQGHGRDKLMTLLWGSHFDAQARQNLRQALTRLRRVLGEDALVSHGESVSLRPDAIACDVTEFEARVSDGSRDALIGAIGLYKGGLLAGIEIPEEAWTEWIEAQRQRVEGLALNAMVKLGEQELEAGNHEPALGAANRAIAISGLREDAHRLIMRALVAGGRRADALKHYEELAALLKRELTVEPDPATRALAAGLRAPRIAQTGSEASSGPHAEPAAETGTVLLPLPDRPSIAVLPFTNMSGDPEQEYFADGMAEDILTALSKWRWLLVYARNSTFTFKGNSLSISRIGEALGARYVLEGSVRSANGRVRISAQLIEAATERHIWADRYDRDLSDVFAAQDEITRQVVSAIDPAIQVSELDHIARKPPGSLDAWDHFLRGSHHRNRFTPHDGMLALQHFSRAIDIDPQFAAAHARLAQMRVNLATLYPTADTPKTLATALELANRAMQLDALDASAHGAAAYALAYMRRHDAALRAARRAVELNGNYHAGHYALGLALLFGGSAREAIRAFEMTILLSPRDPAMWAILGYQALAHHTTGDYKAAFDIAELAVAERSDGGARMVRIAALTRLGHVAEAAAALAQLPSEAFLRIPYLAPFRNSVDWEHFCTALEEAGWKRNAPK